MKSNTFYANQIIYLYQNATYTDTISKLLYQSDWSQAIYLDNEHFTPLLPFFQEARKQNKNVSLKVDKLVLECKTYSVDTLSKLPEYFQTAKLGTRTENGVTTFYWSTSPLSNFHTVEIKDSETGTIYHCGEQWLHNEKAALFKDISTSSEIMYADTPLEYKNPGWNVHNYNDNLWYKSGKASTVMKKINMAKFQQYPEPLAFLKDTAPIIAEANLHNKICGLAWTLKIKRPTTKTYGKGIICLVTS